MNLQNVLGLSFATCTYPITHKLTHNRGMKCHSKIIASSSLLVLKDYVERNCLPVKSTCHPIILLNEGGILASFQLYKWFFVTLKFFCWKLPFLVRLRSSPPLETKFIAVKALDSLPSSTCSSARAIGAPPHPFCSLALRMAAPLKAASAIAQSDGCLKLYSHIGK